MSKNEDLDSVDDKHEFGNDVLDINMESLSSVIQSKLNTCPLYYSGCLYHTNQCRRSETSNSANQMWQDFFATGGVTYPAYAEEESKVPVTVRQYTNRDISPQDVS